MKKVLSFISILIVAFSAVIFTSCAKPYEKVYLEVYDSNGVKLNLDENYNYILDSNSENTFSLTIKVYGLDDEKANITFTRKSTTSAFDISSSRTVQVVNNKADVVIKGDHAGSGRLYARIVESNVVKEIEIPIKIVKKLIALEANPSYNTAVMVGNSISLSGNELLYTPNDTNQKEVTYALKNNVSEKIKLNTETGVLTVDNDYDLASGREIVVTATSQVDSNISADFVVNIVESLSVSDIEVRYDQNDASLATEMINGVATPVVTLVKGATQASYKSTTLAVSVASHYPIDYQNGLAVLVYTSNGQVATVSRIDYDNTRARFLISSDLLADEATISFKVTFAKFSNLAPVVKEVKVRVIDLPTDLLVNDISYRDVANFDFDVYTEYGEGKDGLALSFATSYNVSTEYQQIFLEFVNKADSTLPLILQVNYIDEFGVAKQLSAVDGKYALPIGRTIYISLNKKYAANFIDYMESGIKMNAWLYKTIDRFNGVDVVRGDADKIIAPITLNVKYGITGINAYTESVGSNDFSAINGNIKLVANDIVSGAPSKAVLLDFTPTGLADVNKNITITSSDVSVVKFVIGNNTYTEITGNQLVALNADIAGEEEPKLCYSLVIKGYAKGSADIVITTGNGVTKSIGIETVASTSSLTLSEKSASGNIKYVTTQTTTTGTFSITQYNDVVIPLGSPVNLQVLGSYASSDIAIANEEILTSIDQVGLSNDKIVSLYVVGNQLFINALQTGTNKISLTVFCYTINGEYTSYNISFYVYVYIPVSQFALSTYSETLYQNTGYYERDMAELKLNTIFNKQTATESITLLSTNSVIDVFTIQRTINPSLFEGNYNSVEELSYENGYNISLRLTDKEISATSTVVTIELKEFGVLVSSPRCNITIEQMTKVEKVVVSNVSKKSGAYIIKLDIRDGYYDEASGKTIEEYIANADNNFKQVITSITNLETATIADLEYKIVNYVDENGEIRKGTDGSVRVHQDGNNFYIIPIGGGEVVMHIFPHDSYYTAEEYDLTKAIEITIQVSDGDKVPFQVGTLSQLLAIGNDAESMGYSYQLSTDINLNNKGAYASLPIGKDKTFTGKLNGAYTIARSDGSKLIIQYYLRNAVFSLLENDRYAGLFAVNEGELKNIYIENARYNVYDGTNPINLNAAGTNNYYLGGIAGQNKGLIENCYVQYLTDVLNVNAINFRLAANSNAYNLHIGGVVGENKGSVVANSTMSAGNLLVNIDEDTGILGNNINTYLGGVVGKNTGIISGNYVCEYQQYKLVAVPNETDYNSELYYTKTATGYDLAKDGFDATAEYYALVSAPLASNLNIMEENITSSIDIVVNAKTHNTKVGGIVGENTNKMTNVAYSGDIDVSGIVGKVISAAGSDYVGFAGGIAGTNIDGEITDSLTVFTRIIGALETLDVIEENIDGVDYLSICGAGVVGGVVGYGEGGSYSRIGAQYMTSVDSAVNRSSIQGYGNIGGLIGQSVNEEINFGYVESFYKHYLDADTAKRYNVMHDIIAIGGEGIIEKVDGTKEDITTFAGGLIGNAEDTTINTSYAKLNLYASAENYVYTGGLVGNSIGSTSINNAYYKGNVFNEQRDNVLVANGSANVISSYAIADTFAEYYDDLLLLTDGTNFTPVAKMYNADGNEQEIKVEAGEYVFTVSDSLLSNSISTDISMNTIWYINDKYNDGHPVQLCNRKVFSTLIPTGMRVELLADSKDIMRKAEANKSSSDKNILAGYKYDDTRAILFYRTGNQISEFANYIRLEDIISVTVSPTGAEDYVSFQIESGNNARLATLNGKTCLVITGLGKVELKVFALYNSSLYTTLTFYVTNGVSEVSLYNTTDTSSIQNLLSNGKIVTLTTDSATTFVPVVKFDDASGIYNVSTDVSLDFNTTNSAYKVVENPVAVDRESYYFKNANGEFISARTHNFDENETYYIETENITINNQDATGSFKASESMRIDTVSGEQFYDGKAISNVTVVPYLNLNAISEDFDVGERIDLSTMKVDFSIAVCKRATSVIANYASRSIRSGSYATINVTMATDFVSAASADLSYETLLNMDAVSNTDALRLQVSAQEESAEYVQSILDEYSLDDVKDLFNISCYIETNAYGIVYRDLRLEMKDEYKYITQNISFNFHFFADSNIKANFDFVLNIAPSTVSKINLLHYTETISNTKLGGNTLTNVEKNSATNMIEPGKSGLMVIKVNPVYANVDYFTISSTTVDGYTISFEQMVKIVDASGKETYTTLFPRPSMPRLDKASVVDASGNVSYTGELYVRTLLPTIVAKELNFNVTVEAYINGVAERINFGEIPLLTSYIPSIKMTVDAEDAVAVYDYQEVEDSKLDKDNITIYYIYNSTTGKYEKATVYITGTTYYVREKYYLIENHTNNITINMEVIGYEFGDPSFSVTPKKEGLTVLVPRPSFRLTASGAYVGSSNIYVSSANVGETFNVESEIMVTRNGITKKSTDVLKFIIVENLIRPNNVTLDNLTDDSVLSMAMGSSMPLDLRWLTDSGSIDSAKEETINNTLYEDIAGEGINADYDKVLSLFYVKRNTISGVIKEPLQLGTDSSNVFKINKNIFVDHTGKETFNGFSLIGTSQTSTTTLGFSVYYYYEMTASGIELNFTTDLSLNEDYILTEINFEFTLLVYFNSTEKEPIPIYTANQFKSYLSTASNESYILMEDITLQDYTPNDAEFISLDGNGKIVRVINFVPTNPASESVAQIGLFKEIRTGTLIKNVTLDLAGLKDINVSAYEGYKIGALAVKNSGVITNCDVVSLRGTDVTAKTKEITITSKNGATTEHLAGFVVENVGNITNSRLGVAYFDSYRVGVTNNTVITSQTRYYSDDICFNAKGSMAGFVFTNSGIVSSCYARGISLNNTSTDMVNSKTAGFVVNNTNRIYYSYVRGSGSITSSEPRIKTNLIKSNGDVAGFVSNNSGYIGDSYANIGVYSVAKFTAGFVGKNTSSGRIQRSYSACDIVSNAPSMMPFTGENLLHEIQDESNGGIQDCYYLILSGEYFDAEKDSATGMSLTSFQVASTLNGYAFIESTDKTEKASGVWTYGAENIADDKAIVVDNYTILPDLTSPNIIAKSVRYLETELTDEEGIVTGYVYQYVKGFEYGSEANPYIIRSAKEYNTVFADALTEDASQTVQVLTHVRMVQDIDFMDVGNEVKTRERVIFSGSLDGNGMQINNISITSNTTDKTHESLGMFSKITKANTISATTPVIKNITLNFTKVSGTSMTYVGGLAGVIENSIIINVNLTGGITVQAYNFGGGLAGLITGKTRIMNINSNLSVSVGKSNHALDADGNYIPNVYYSYEDYAKLNSYATQAVYTRYMQQLSYGGGLAGVIDIYSETNVDTIDLSQPNVYLVNINVDASKNTVSTLGSNVSIFADIVGGVAGYLGEETFMASTKYYINASASSTSYLEGYYIVGGLVGENNGKIVVSEAISQLDNQFTIDSANGEYFRGDSNTMSGNISAVKGSYFAGGLIGLNYQGVMEHCDTRLSLYNTTARFVGGIVGGTLGGAFNTMFTTSIIPLATEDGCYTGGFAGVVFDTSDQKGINKESVSTNTENRVDNKIDLSTYIGDYLKIKYLTKDDEMEVMMNRVVSSAIYDRNQLSGLDANRNGLLVGYSSMSRDNYTGSQLDSLYASSAVPTNCYVNNIYITTPGNTKTLNVIGSIDANIDNRGERFDSDIKTFDIGVLSDVEDVSKQRPEFQKVFGEWNLTYWTALDETKIYPRLLQVGFGSVIEIAKESDFQFIYNNPAGNYIITRDIKLSGEYTDCIIGVNFTGRITGYKEDGSAPTIFGIRLHAGTSTNQCLAFFHSTEGATISNIHFRYIELNAESRNGNVAGLIALDKGGTKLSDITMGFSSVEEMQATVDGYGYDNGGSYVIKASYATNVGGIVAQSLGTSISNCISRMDIETDGESVGGIIGCAEIGSRGEEPNKQIFIPSVVNSYYYGTINCSTLVNAKERKNVGGIVGSLTGGTVNNSTAHIPLDNNNPSINVASKDKPSTIICSSNEAITSIGGIVGKLSDDASVASCNDVKIKIEIKQNSSQNEFNIGYIVGNADGVSVTSSTTTTDDGDCCIKEISISEEAKSDTLETFSMGGLIGYANNVVLKDSSVYVDITNKVGHYIRSEVYYMGQAIGRATGNMEVTGILATGNIGLYAQYDSESYIGGLIGGQGKVSGSTTESMELYTSAHFGTLTIDMASKTSLVGGIVGYANNTEIINCQSAGELVVSDTAEMGKANNTYKVAGIAGLLEDNSKITTCVVLTYFNMSRDVAFSNVFPFANYSAGEDNSVTKNIYSADYSFVTDIYGDTNNTCLLASEMMGYGLVGYTNQVSKNAVNQAMAGDAKAKLVILHGETGDTTSFWKMGGYAGYVGSGSEYVMPFLISLENRLNQAGLFEEGSILRPKVIDDFAQASTLTAGKVGVLVKDSTVDSKINTLSARIVGCHVTLTLNARLADTISESGAISGVIIGKSNDVNLTNQGTADVGSYGAGTGLIASVNQGTIFDITFNDEISVTGAIPMGVVAYVNNGVIYGCGVSSDITGITRPIAGIAYYNAGRIENSYVTADMSGVAKNSNLSAGLVYANTAHGYMSNTYFAGTLVSGESNEVSAGMTTNDGNINRVYVDYYAMGKEDSYVSENENITTKYLQINSIYKVDSDKQPLTSNLFDADVWVQQRYDGSNNHFIGRECKMFAEKKSLQTLNFGYPLLDLGTKKYNPDAANKWDSIYTARFTGDGTESDPVQIINLGTLDYMRSLGANIHITHFKLTRDIYTKQHSSYMLTKNWSVTQGEGAVQTAEYYGDGTVFSKVFSGGNHTIQGLYGGALLNTVEGGKLDDDIVSGIVKDLRMINSNANAKDGSGNPKPTGIVVGTLTTGIVTNVTIDGELNEALAGIVGTMNTESQVYDCTLTGKITALNGDVSGVCDKLDGENAIINNIRLDSLRLSGNGELSGVARNMSKGFICGITGSEDGHGTVVLEGVQSDTSLLAGMVNTLTGGTVGNAEVNGEPIGDINKLLVITSSGHNVGGIVRSLNGGDVQNNIIQIGQDNTKPGFQSTYDADIGGIVVEALSGNLLGNSITFNAASNASVKRFGGLVCVYTGTNAVTVSDNTINGIVQVYYGGANSVGGLLSEITVLDMNMVFTNNKIETTIINTSDAEGSGSGGFFGNVSAKYDFRKTEEPEPVKLARDVVKNGEGLGNVFTGTIDGVKNVGGQVGRYSAEYHENAFLAETQSATVIGEQNVGGVVGYLEAKNVGTEIELKALKNNNIIKTKGGKNVGGIFGYVDESVFTGKENAKLIVTGMINNGNIVIEGEGLAPSNYVGGIIGKLGAELEFKDDGGNDSVQVVFDSPTYKHGYAFTGNTNNGSIGGKHFVGGLIGSVASETDIIDLSSNDNSGSTTIGAGAVGGFAGYLHVPNESTDTKLYMMNINNASNLELTTSFKKSYFGGIVGTIYSTNRTLVSEITDSVDAGGSPIKVESCKFTGLTNTGSLAGHNYVGGLFGKIESTSGSVSGFNDITIGAAGKTITGNNYVGGIMGYYKIDNNITAETFKITECSNIANVSGNKYVGGLFGHLDLTRWKTNGDNVLEVMFAKDAEKRAIISDNTNSGSITVNDAAEGYLGGLIGYLDASKMVVDINELNNTGVIKGAGEYVGGIFGKADLNDESITFERTEGTEPGAKSTEEDYKTEVHTLTNAGIFDESSAGKYVGGIFGYLDYADSNPTDGKAEVISETIYDMKNTGHVVGERNVGGIFGYANNFELHGRRPTYDEYGKIKVDANGFEVYERTVYSNEGKVSGVENVGGIIGSTEHNILGLGNDHQTIEAFENTTTEINAESKGKLRATKAGTDYSLSELSGIVVKGQVNGKANVGGLVGKVEDKIIEYVESSADIGYKGGTSSVDGCVGGIVGHYKPSEKQDLTMIINDIEIDSESNNVGGLIGKYEFTSSTTPLLVKNLTYATVTIKNGAENTGGLFGTVKSSGLSIIDFGYGEKVSSTSSTKPADKENVSFLAKYARVAEVEIQSATGENIGGLFGSAQSVSIKHLKLDFEAESGGYDISINASGANNVGGIVGYANFMNIGSNSESGSNLCSTMIVNAKVTGGQNVGGIIGFNDGTSQVANLSPRLMVKGSTDVGGIIGRSENSTDFINFNLFDDEDYYTNSVDGTNNVGGLVGSSNKSILTTVGYSYVDYKVTATGSSVGGIVGEYVHSGKLQTSVTVNSLIKGAKNVGGFVGKISSSNISTVESTWVLGNDAEVSGDNLTKAWAIGYIDTSSSTGVTSSFNLTVQNYSDITTENHLVGTFEQPFYVSGSMESGNEWHTLYSPYTKWSVRSTGDQPDNYSFKRILASTNSPIFTGFNGDIEKNRTFYDITKEWGNNFLVEATTKLSLTVSITSKDKNGTCTGDPYEYVEYEVNKTGSTGGGSEYYEYNDMYAELPLKLVHKWKIESVGEGNGGYDSAGNPSPGGGYTKEHIGDDVSNQINQFYYDFQTTYCWKNGETNYLTDTRILEKLVAAGLVYSSGGWNLSNFDSGTATSGTIFADIIEVRNTSSISFGGCNLQYVSAG